MHTGDLCFFTGASLFIVGVVGYFFTGPNNKGVYLLSSFVFFVVNVISVCMLPDNFLVSLWCGYESVCRTGCFNGSQYHTGYHEV